MSPRSPAGRGFVTVRKTLAVALVSVLWTVLGGGAAIANHDGSLGVFPPDASPYGKTYAQWQGAYQIWLNEIPAPENPLVDPLTARNCEVQPGGDITFLGGAGADCSVPAGTALAFSPALGFWECSTAEGLGETWQELRTCARENFAFDLDPAKYHQKLRIDGDRLVHQRRWVSHTPGEIIDFPEDNLWGAEPGPSRSITKGFLFILEPLDAGEHRIVVVVQDEALGDFRWVWKLHVEEGASG